MSSAGFEAELVPARRVRRALVAFAGAATLAGGLLIALMPLAVPLRTLFALLWLCAGVLELRAMALGMARLDRIQIAPDGRVRGLSREGAAEPLELCSGSVVLARVAWLRIRFADGSSYGELLTGTRRHCRDWRRLQLLWRQRSSVFGRPQGS